MPELNTFFISVRLMLWNIIIYIFHQICPSPSLIKSFTRPM
uniref:Uncharacterized protein n=1 Tax=Klebsiella pneumoniae TaxID=573 RepID=A0A8B0SSN0_KLEPN|nr:hypothetical protein [Klebsiella pneumoniae]